MLIVVAVAISGMALSRLFGSGGPGATPLTPAVSAAAASTLRNSIASPTLIVEDNVAVFPPNVYNLPKQEGLNQLAAAGFTKVTSGVVCSGSVLKGFIRQVVIDDGSAVGNERIVVDKAGALRKVLHSTKLFVKIGSGSQCP